MSDTLDKWRRALRKDEGPAAAPAPPPAVAEQPAEEVAEEKQPTRYRLGCIELRPLRGLRSLPTYAQLIDVLFDGKPTSFIALVFLHQVVIIKGRNLDSHVAGLRMRTQWLIEQHALPQAKGEPFVEEMEFITEDVPGVVAALRAGVSPPPKNHPPARIIGT